MAGSKSNYLENKVLDGVLGGTNFTQPTPVYLALFTAAPSDTGGGTEVSGGSYVRLTITNNSTNWPAASGGAKSNGADFNFVEATANWGTIVAWALFDAVSSGNMLYWGDCTQQQTINIGSAARFKSGDIDLSED